MDATTSEFRLNEQLLVTFSPARWRIKNAPNRLRIGWSWRSPSASILNAWRLASAAPPDAVDALIEPICSTRKPCVELAYVGCLQAGEDCPSAGALNMRFMGERDGSLAPFD